MSVLLLRLAGPLQSWGDSSRYTRRLTRNEPTKSGVVGLLAAALGRSRENAIDDLAALEFAVRSDQPGELLRDFQTERSADGKTTMPLTHRFYLADACFLVALSGSKNLLDELDAALESPHWPLFLGRRSCPPDLPISLGVHDEYADVRVALGCHEWLASEWRRREVARLGVDKLEVAADARPGESFQTQDDLPLTFSGSGRRYARRHVRRYWIAIADLDSAGERRPGDKRTDASSDSPSNESASSPNSHVACAQPDHDPLFF